ncbi:cupin domain-containing protein [Chitinimonas sp.]|uniref:cupin domain-containing protein n=1 Tax=Chitinimonas sp. TaxID=1934313 RepID=UPI002F94A075
MSTPLRFAHLYTDADGVTQFGQADLPLTPRVFAPPASPFSVSALEPAERCGFLHLPAGWVGERHPSPMRMWIFVLTGEMEFEAGDGEKHRIAPGSALLLEDTHGSGHLSRVLGNSPTTLAAVQLPEG